MADVEKLIDEISNMTVLELSELVKALEDKFGVSAAAAAPMMVAAGAVPGAAEGAAAEAAPAEEEQTEFTVQLKEIGPNKIPVIKEVRAVTDDSDLKKPKRQLSLRPMLLRKASAKKRLRRLRASWKLSMQS